MSEDSVNAQQLVERTDIIDRIHKQVAYLNPALRRIGEYILEHPDEAKTMTIKQLAGACAVAEATVIRFVREIGLQGYQELKIGIAEALILNGNSGPSPEEAHVYEDIARTDAPETIIDKIVYRNMQALADTKQRLSVTELNRAVEAIEGANLLVFCCMGASSLAAEEGALRFTRAGKKCLLYRDQSMQLMSAAIVGAGDVVIGISNSGHSKLVVDSLKLARANGAQTIAITSFEDSPLVKHADVTLFTPTKTQTLGPGLHWEATSSKSAQILIVDILYACYAAKHFDETITYLQETSEAIRDTRET